MTPLTANELKDTFTMQFTQVTARNTGNFEQITNTRESYGHDRHDTDCLRQLMP